MKTDITIEDCLKGAWQALLNGDTKTRDTLCAMAEKTFVENNAEVLPANTSVLNRNIVEAEYEIIKE